MYWYHLNAVAQILRDPSLLSAQFGLTCVVALLIGAVFFDLNYDLDVRQSLIVLNYIHIINHVLRKYAMRVYKLRAYRYI